jgi:hypothetical protein
MATGERALVGFLLLAAIGLVVAGTALVYLPAGLIVAGLLLGALAVAWLRGALLEELEEEGE